MYCTLIEISIMECAFKSVRDDIIRIWPRERDCERSRNNLDVQIKCENEEQLEFKYGNDRMI